MVEVAAEPAYILCGGRSSRFGSDKARALIEGEALLVRLARWTRAQGCQPVLGVAQDAGAYADLGIGCIADARPGRLGPLAGLEAALAHRLQTLGPGALLLLSCDLLELRPEWLAVLRAGPAAPARVFRAADGLWHPLPGRYHTDLLPALGAALDAGVRSFQRFLAMSPAAQIPAPEGGFPQANRPEDLPAAP